jgi:hypothetical protein
MRVNLFSNFFLNFFSSQDRTRTRTRKFIAASTHGVEPFRLPGIEPDIHFPISKTLR